MSLWQILLQTPQLKKTSALRMWKRSFIPVRFVRLQVFQKKCVALALHQKTQFGKYCNIKNVATINTAFILQNIA